MRLTPYILQLYFESYEGILFQTGLAELVGDGAAEPVAAPDDVVAAEQTANGDEGDDDDDSTDLSPSEYVRLILDDCFSEVEEALKRTISERNAVRPATREHARALFESLLESGIEVFDKDVDAFVSRTEEPDLDEDAEPAEPDLDDDSEPIEPHSDDDGETDPLDTPDGNAPIWVIGGDSDDGKKLWVESISAISWALHCFAPELFIPYAFVHSFHRFEAICDEFEIPLPRLPGKAGNDARCRYYLELNDALNEFRVAHGLTATQFCAFLYGFCGEHVPTDELAELPPPRRAWFLMANPEVDFDQLDAADDDSRFHWQGAYEMRPGDVAVMWCRSPRSYVHSIWRATSRGFADPFFYYYRTVWIGRGQRVTPLPFRDLQADPTWAAKPATRAHFQNSSGREVTPAEYDALLRLLEGKGFDTSSLPRLERLPAFSLEGLETERDVEAKLLEPALMRLGYTAKDWVRQLPVRMGRGERFYPDYAFGVTGERGEESARMTIEAKFRIATDAELRDAYLQARSYAERLRAMAFLLCDASGLWLFSRRNERFTLHGHTFHPWDELNEAPTLAAIEGRIGKSSDLWKVRRG